MALVVGTNSYASLADADTYFEDSIRGTAWLVFTVAQRSAGLVEATRVFERMKWLGKKTISTQALAYPRDDLKGLEGETVTGAESLLTASEALYEYAFAILSDESMLDSDDATGSNIKSMKAGSARMEFFRATTGSRFPIIIMNIIGRYLASSGSAVGMTPTVCGTDVKSGFSDRHAYGKNGAL